MYFVNKKLTKMLTLIQEHENPNKILLLALTLFVDSMLILTVISYFSMAKPDEKANDVCGYLIEKASASGEGALNNLPEEVKIVGQGNLDHTVTRHYS